MPKETIATTDVYNGDVPHTNILKVAWGARGACPEASDGWVNAGYAHLYIGTKDQPFLGSVELGEDEIDHLIRVLKRVRRQAFRAVRDATPTVWGADIANAVSDAIKKEAQRHHFSAGY